MNKILFTIPQKGEEEELFLDILSKEYKIDRSILDILKKYFGENLYLILNVFAGKQLKIPSTENLDTICLMIRLYKKINKLLEQNISFDDIIIMLSREFSLSTNKVFRMYSDMKLFNNKGGEVDEDNKV